MSKLEDFKEAYLPSWGPYDCCKGLEKLSQFFDAHPEVEVLGWVEGENDGPPGAALLKARDGVWTFWEWRDYTGHGCQCDSSLEGPYENLQAAWLFGLDENARLVLQAQFPDLINP